MGGGNRQVEDDVDFPVSEQFVHRTGAHAELGGPRLSALWNHIRAGDDVDDLPGGCHIEVGLADSATADDADLRALSHGQSSLHRS